MTNSTSRRRLEPAVSFPALLLVGFCGTIAWAALDPSLLLSDVLYGCVLLISCWWVPLWPRAAARHTGLNWLLHWCNGVLLAVGTLVLATCWTAGLLPAFGAP